MSQPPKPKPLPAALKGGGKAEIFAPQKGGYTLKGKGGMVGRQVAEAPPQPAPAPKPAPKPAPAAPPPAATQPAPPPKPAPVPKPAPPPAPAKKAEPANKSEELADSFFETLMGRLIGEAKQKGGSLTVQDLENFGKATRQDPQGLQLDFQHSLDEYVKSQELAGWNETRDHPFGRLLVKKISHLFADQENPSFDTGALSRRVLPGFFIAMNMMLGQEKVDECQIKSNHHVQRIKKAHGNKFTWDLVYDDKPANKVVLDALVIIAGYFEDMEKRVTWMFGLITGNMKPPTPDMDRQEAAWEMTEKHLYTLLNSLFADLRKALGTEAARNTFAEKHGPATLKKVIRILKTVNGRAS